MELDQAYRENVNDLYRYLYSLAKNHHIAEDLVQEAFYRAYVHLEDYEIYNIRAWLFKVAYHAFIDFQRKNKRLIIQDPLKENGPVEESPEKRLLEKEGFKRLLKDIDSLKEQEKHVLLLCDLHQLTYYQASEVLEMNVNTLKSHLHRGRKKVMKRVKERMRADEG
ncbi:sigma-70 family RNA polymerase sigma factor [Neobacillus mesonae]|uniref:sigma-70 family RNA polymerase sigma factor n=1 Tax=Neobacillus mesonae TaxID=1193713 RepID=UPI00203EFD66|nr:sigma-70 family RNA polymerase sigma factor [Neobacillus mesonae]MCM3570675.1 sigma-70 family RNA polymerase sigma factor [Neobacillus mesonae]